MREKGGIEVGAAFLCRFGVKSDSVEFVHTLFYLSRYNQSVSHGYFFSTADRHRKVVRCVLAGGVFHPATFRAIFGGFGNLSEGFRGPEAG